jgi:hypothetical protein
MDLCNCFHLVLVDNNFLSRSSFNEFCTWEMNYADGQGFMLLAVKILPMLALLKSYVRAYASQNPLNQVIP